MIYFVRHGQSEANEAGRFAGTTNSPLTDNGRLDAFEIAAKLKAMGVRPSRIVSSSLSRARDTAIIIAMQLGSAVDEIIIDGYFNEYDFGDLNDQLKQGVGSEEFMQTPNREEPEVLYARLRDGWNAYAQLSGDTLIVSHSFVRLGIECALNGGDMALFHDRASTKESNSEIGIYPQVLI
jgi:broad specificity phosphatase PhoE